MVDPIGVISSQTSTMSLLSAVGIGSIGIPDSQGH
jgi:hypothetical protein